MCRQIITNGIFYVVTLKEENVRIDEMIHIVKKNPRDQNKKTMRQDGIRFPSKGPREAPFEYFRIKYVPMDGYSRELA